MFAFVLHLKEGLDGRRFQKWKSHSKTPVCFSWPSCMCQRHNVKHSWSPGLTEHIPLLWNATVSHHRLTEAQMTHKDEHSTPCYQAQSATFSKCDKRRVEVQQPIPLRQSGSIFLLCHWSCFTGGCYKDICLLTDQRNKREGLLKADMYR